MRPSGFQCDGTSSKASKTILSLLLYVSVSWLRTFAETDMDASMDVGTCSIRSSFLPEHLKKDWCLFSQDPWNERRGTISLEDKDKEEMYETIVPGSKKHEKAQTAQKVVPLEQYRKAVEEEVRRKVAESQQQKETWIDSQESSERKSKVEANSKEDGSEDGRALTTEGVEEDVESLGRVNYASVSDGAKVLGFNKEAKGVSNVLNENKDTYMISPCKSEKWFVMELSQEAAVDSLVIANYEFYSSSVNEFEVLGTQEHPQFTKEGKETVQNMEGGVEWMHLGFFQAPKNLRKPHMFTIKEPAWVRYLQIRLLTHHGEETYCTLSLLRVHGTDTMESLRKEIELASKEVEDFELALRSSNEEYKNPASQDLGDSPQHDSPISSEEKGEKMAEADPGITTHKVSEETMNTTAGLGGLDQPPGGKEHEAHGSLLNSSEKSAAVDESVLEILTKLDSAKNTTLGAGSNASLAEVPANGSSVQSSTVQRPSPQPRGSIRQENVMNILVKKVKMLELNLTVIDKYVGDLSAKYKAAFAELAQESTHQEEQLTDLMYRVSKLELQKADADDVFRQKVKTSIREELALHDVEIGALQMALYRARTREYAASGISFLLGTLLLLNRPSLVSEGSLFYHVVTGLAIANGFVSFILQWKLLL